MDDQGALVRLRARRARAASRAIAASPLPGAPWRRVAARPRAAGCAPSRRALVTRRAAAAAQRSASPPAPAASRLPAATAARGAQPAICSGVNSLSQRCDRLVAPVGDVLGGAGPQAVARHPHVARRDRMTDREIAPPRGTRTRRSPAGEARDSRRGSSRRKLGAQHLGEQDVVPVGLAVTVEADQQGVGTREVGEHATRSRAVRARHRRAAPREVSSMDVRVRNAAASGPSGARTRPAGTRRPGGRRPPNRDTAARRSRSSRNESAAR